MLALSLSHSLCLSRSLAIADGGPTDLQIQTHVPHKNYPEPIYSCVQKKIFKSATGSNRNSREHDREQEDPRDRRARHPPKKLPSHSELLLCIRCFLSLHPVSVKWLQLRANTPPRRSQKGRRRRAWNRQGVRGLQGGRRKGEIKKSEEGGRCKKKRLKINREGGRRGGGEFNGKREVRDDEERVSAGPWKS